MAQAQSSIRVEIGTLIADTYEITSLLGRGGMGTVWEASHARLPGKKVAIKVLHPEVAKDQESLARFRREAEIASRIGHPNIVDVHDFNELEDGTPYLILEYLEGISLEDRMDQGPFQEDEVIAIVRQIGSALKAAHAEGVVHRDLKPANVFLARTTDVAGNETARARVLDFGISKIRGSSTVQTQDSTILGTPQYMAPEQATGNHSAVDQRTDVFALGAMVYEMLAGRPAFDGQTIPEVVFKVVYEEPTPLDQRSAASMASVQAVHRALAKKQEERFQTVEAFIEALSGTTLSVRGAPIPSAVHQRQSEDVGLASTMASGNYASVPGVAASSPDLGVAATIDSGKLDQASLGLGPNRAAVAESVASRPRLGGPQEQQNFQGSQNLQRSQDLQSPKKSGAGGLKVALALVTILAIGAIGAAFWAFGRTSADESPDTAENLSPENSPDAMIVAAVVADAGVATFDASRANDSKEPATKLTKKEEREKKRREKKEREKKEREKKEREKKERENDATATTDVKPPTAGVDEPNADYDQARKLLNSNPRKAVRIIRRAIGNTGGQPRFYVLQAKAFCKLKDLTQLNSTLNKLSPRRQRSVKAYCKRHWPGYD